MREKERGREGMREIGRDMRERGTKRRERGQESEHTTTTQISFPRSALLADNNNLFAVLIANPNPVTLRPLLPTQIVFSHTLHQSETLYYCEFLLHPQPCSLRVIS